MKNILLIIFFFYTLFAYSQDKEPIVKDTIIQQLNSQLMDAEKKNDFNRMTSLLLNPEIKKHLEGQVYAAYYVQLFVLSERQILKPADKDFMLKAIVDQSQDSIFQTNFVKLLRIERYKELESYLDLIKDIHYDEFAYLINRSIALDGQGQYAEADSINDGILMLDESVRNFDIFYTIAKKEMEYGENSYFLGNKEQAISYYTKALTNLCRVYDLSIDNACTRYKVVSTLQSLINYLMSIRLLSLEEMSKYSEKVDFTSYFFSTTCF